jgi:hypothetical protein
MKTENLVKLYVSTKNPLKRKRIAEQLYLEFFSDFLTVSRFAEYYGVSEPLAQHVIDEGRKWNHLPKIEAIEA